MSLKSTKAAETVTQSLKPAARTASANGTGVDVRGFNNVKVYFDLGTWTDGTHAWTIEESDNNSDYTAVAAGNLDGSLPSVTSGSNDDTVAVVGLTGKVKRYVRAVCTITGSPATGAVAGAFVVASDKYKV